MSLRIEEAEPAAEALGCAYDASAGSDVSAAFALGAGDDCWPGGACAGDVGSRARPGDDRG